jgi:hypothetical protein
MKSMTLSPHLLTLVRDYGHNKAVAWLEGSEELAIADDDLTSFLSRHDVEFDHLTESDRDALRDLYLETIKLIFAQRLASSPVTVEVPLGKPGGPTTTSGSLDRVHSDVPPVERLLTEAHDAMVEAEDALTEFCGHNDETRGGWALQSLTRSIENIRAIQRIAGFIPFSLTPPVSTQIDSSASLTSPARIPIELTHPTIHGDYYDWLKSLSGKEFENDFIKQHSRDFKEFNAIAMWAWSQSRETLAQKWKAAPHSPEKPVVQPSLGGPEAIRPPVGENPPQGADVAPAWRDIDSAPRDGTFILLAGPSGYVTTPLRVEVGRYDAVYRPLNPWVTFSNDAFTDGGEPPTLWMPLPAADQSPPIHTEESPSDSELLTELEALLWKKNGNVYYSPGDPSVGVDPSYFINGETETLSRATNLRSAIKAAMEQEK